MSDFKVSELFREAGVQGWQEAASDRRKAGLVEFQDSHCGTMSVEVDQSGTVVKFTTPFTVEVLERLLAPAGVKPVSFVPFSKGEGFCVCSEV